MFNNRNNRTDTEILSTLREINKNLKTSKFDLWLGRISGVFTVLAGLYFGALVIDASLKQLDLAEKTNTNQSQPAVITNTLD